MVGHFTFAPFDVYTASDEEYAVLHAFAMARRAEQLPDDPPIPLDEFMLRYRNVPRSVQPVALVARTTDGEIVGNAMVFTPPTEDNRHLIQMDIEVLPAFRRQGIGKELLRFVANRAQQDNRSLLIGATAERVPAGAIFAERIGATRGLEAAVNQLVLAEVDWALLRRWQEQAATDDFEMVWLEGSYPEEILIPMVELFNLVVNAAPHDDLDVEDQQLTPELVREGEKMTLSAGTQRWTAYVRARADGAFAGLTEIMWHPNRPHLANQGWTGVHTDFRGRKLGRWLKAAMLEKLFNERPQVQYVRTGNANSNTPMLRINQELGFRPYIAETIWQVKVEQVMKYLDAGG